LEIIRLSEDGFINPLFIQMKKCRMTIWVSVLRRRIKPSIDCYSERTSTINLYQRLNHEGMRKLWEKG